MKNVIFLIFILSGFLWSKEIFYTQTIKVAKQKVQESRSYYGTFVENDSLVRVINTRVDGFVEKLLIKDQYSTIQQGDKLFVLYSPELLQAQNEYVNALKFRSNLALIEKKLLLLGLDKKVIQAIKKTKKTIASFPVYSQYEGIVFEKNIIEGQYIKKGEPLYRVVDLKTLWFVVRIPQNDQAFINQIQEASLKVEGFATPVKMKFLKALPNLKDKFIEVRFLVENEKQKLFPKMFGIATLKQPAKSILMAPKNSVLLRNGKYYVFSKTEEETFEPVEVRVRALENGDFEILEGIAENTQIAQDALFILDADVQNNGGYE